MKFTPRYLSLALLALTLALALATGAAEPSAEVRLAIGETGRSGVIELTFLEVLEDSRCPTGVTCVSAGRARIAVNAVPPGGEKTRIELSTESEAAGRAEVGRHTVRLVRVEPYPMSQEAIPPASYHATLISDGH